MKKVIFYLLLLVNFLLPLAIVSNRVDGDLGWHLRFGQELHNGIFPYIDTYTYSKYGTAWTNHEWGGGWLIWLIYSRLGYWWLNLCISLMITFSFLLIGKTYFKKITSVFLAVTLLCQLSIMHIYVTRLALLAMFFAALTIYLLENSKNNRRFLFAIPPLFWLWSALHGSWILGFIIANIYIGSAIVTKFIPNKFLPKIKEVRIPTDLIYKIFSAQIVAALMIIINPYGITIWKEIIQYFGQSYYKMHTTEWLPSYVFPIFWQILIIQTIALVFCFYGFFKKKINLTNLLIFTAFYYAAFTYKRQAVFIGLLSAVVLTGVVEYILIELQNVKIFHNTNTQKILQLLSIFVLVFLSTYYVFNIHFTNNVWEDKYLAERNAFPFDGVHWLQSQETKPIKIFNTFHWGAYLNWTMPNALIYFDGRGTATWMYDKNITMLERYQDIVFNPGGLEKIEADNVDYILLRQPSFISITKPDLINNWMFGKEAAVETLSEPLQLENEINKSANWKKVYSDRQVNIWQNINHALR